MDEDIKDEHGANEHYILMASVANFEGLGRDVERIYRSMAADEQRHHDNLVALSKRFCRSE